MSFDYSCIHVDTADRITVVTMARPERRNAVDGVMAFELYDAFARFDDDPDADVAILYGEGGTFCAGADLTAVGTDRQNRLEVEGPGPMGPSRMRLTKPVIAAIEGYAVAGGLELAVWCDLRIVAEDATFGVFCRRWGVPLIDGGTVRLPRLIGESRAMDLILTGRPVTADEALAMGLANRVVRSGEALPAARTLAMEIASFPQTCLRNDRASVMNQAGRAHEEAMAYEFQVGLESLVADGQHGAARFAGGEGRHGAF
ncbi:MAG TPA: crotonase/enoyl-CoA hydratase family protein [Marmoricola sp.]|nr:crotonase/enoyl-CoA hydratase family protein [Marmoricola sp.]